MITPERMAEIYGNRAGKSAFREVAGLIRYFHEDEQTVMYWIKVQRYLEFRFGPNEYDRRREA